MTSKYDEHSLSKMYLIIVFSIIIISMLSLLNPIIYPMHICIDVHICIPLPLDTCAFNIELINRIIFHQSIYLNYALPDFKKSYKICTLNAICVFLWAGSPRI